MAARVQTLTVTQAATFDVRLRVQAGVDELLDILGAHPDWQDPLSQKIRDWALSAFEGIDIASASEEALTARMRSIGSALDQEILIDSLKGAPLREVPYLIDTENVLGESAFDDLYYTACQAQLRVSPFNNKPIELRQKVHTLALAILNWRGRRCESTPPPEAVPFLVASNAILKYLNIHAEAQRRLDGQRSEQTAEIARKAEERAQVQTEQIRVAHREARETLVIGIGEELRASNARMIVMRREHGEQMEAQQRQIDGLQEQIREMLGQVREAEEVTREQRRTVADLERRISIAQAELARLRDMDDGWCVIA